MRPTSAASGGFYAGVPMEDWIEAPKRVRQQSARYPSGYIQDFDLDVFEHREWSTTATPTSPRR